MIRRGQRLGRLGKEGGSGGWSHQHFEIKSRQPSGKWGTQEDYLVRVERANRRGWKATARLHARAD
jgi:hypothetical protein